MKNIFDVIIIGGGFFGCQVALSLKSLGIKRILIIESENALMKRASLVNQARVHNGYHYPRALQTGISSRKNYFRFLDEYKYAIKNDVQMIYAIARNSKINANQFSRFCDEIGAFCIEDKKSLNDLFDPTLIETSFKVNELSFNAKSIALNITEKLKNAGVDILLSTTGKIKEHGEKFVKVETSKDQFISSYVFNCTYAYLDNVGIELNTSLKKELGEIALIKPPPSLEGRAVTVMDGPFFSTMPYPAKNCYSLTHVRYTPHCSWTSGGEIHMKKILSRSKLMIRDASRYMPDLNNSIYLRSIYELKAILISSEDNDSRPILYERSRTNKRIISILGAKLDNIYDIQMLLSQEDWQF